MAVGRFRELINQMRSRRRDSTTYAMQGTGTAVTLLLLLLKVCSAAPHGGSAPAPTAEMFSPHSNGQLTTAQSVVAERDMATTWDTEAGVSELTTHTAGTSGDTVPPTTTELGWTTHRDQEGTTTTTTTTGDDHTEQAATTELRQTQTQAWEEWTTQASTLLNGALGDVGNSDSHYVTAESDRTVATDTLEKDEQASAGAELQCRDCMTPAEVPAVGTEEEALETETKPASRDVTGPQLHLQHHAYDPANPYDHFDSDSEEQEMEVEQEHHPQTAAGSQEEERDQQQEEEEEETLGGLEYEDSLGPGSTEGQPAAAAVATTQRSYLLQLAGNSTIVMLRRSDFAKYLKLNLAARLSLEYDNVKVNRVLLEPPRLLVNVSVITPDEGGGGGAGAAGGGPQPEDQQEEPLHALAEANATLLELSGEEYHVVRMLPLRSRKSSRDGGAGGDQEEEGDAEDLEAAERYTDGELAAYCVLGGACAVAAVGALLLASARYLRGLAACLLGGGGGGGAGAGGGHGGGEALLQSFLSAPWRLRHHRMADAAGAAPGAPSVIYSGSFAGSGADATASWTSGLQPQQQQQQQSPSTPAASRLRLFSCRSTSLLLPPRRIGLPTKDLLQPLSTPAGHENPAYRE
ncbi:uncharacterized protein LOC124620225 [Schistocerca americana]|uniref:uncharacterized protein LOC124620225 n=1 Tax=Schistocerca americana TaxID=7009 RepID=UPI001F5032EB|nr:uncharacterized protein LOC124620225 [Schistocerca americana]